MRSHSPKMRRDQATPLSGQVKSDLLEQIQSGRLKGRAPGELALAQQYGVSRVTVRRALAELEQEGLLSRSRGRGTYVSEARARKLKTVHFVLHYSSEEGPWPAPHDYPIIHEILAGAASGARQHGVGFNVISADYHMREPAAALKGFGPGDGLVIVGTCELVAVASAMGIAAVSCYHTGERTAPYRHLVLYDRKKAVGMGMRHLMECGAREVVYAIQQPPGQSGWVGKVQEARRVAQAFGAQLPPERLLDVSPYAEVAGAQIEQYLRTHRAPDAFLCGTDDVAAGALSAFQKLGVLTPDDIMVVGYGDFSFARRLSPPLTTLRIPRFEIGERAVQALARVVAAGPDAEPVLDVMQAELVVRETTRGVA